MPQSLLLLLSPNFEEKWTSLRTFKGSKARDFQNFYATVPLTVAVAGCSVAVSLKFLKLELFAIVLLRWNKILE